MMRESLWLATVQHLLWHSLAVVPSVTGGSASHLFMAALRQYA